MNNAESDQVIFATFRAFAHDNYDTITEATQRAEAARQRTFEQLRRIRSRACRLTKQKIFRIQSNAAETEKERHAAFADFQLQESIKLKQYLINNVSRECKRAVREVLLAIVQEIPRLALDSAFHKLDMLLTKFSGVTPIHLSAASTTLSHTPVKQLYSDHRVTPTEDQSLLPGSFTLTLPTGKILSSVEKDIEQLLAQWNESLSLIKELHIQLGEYEDTK